MNGEVELKLEVDPKRVRRLKRHALLKQSESELTPKRNVTRAS